VRVLLTDSDTLLGGALASVLAQTHDLTAWSGDPRDRSEAASVRDHDAIVHLIHDAGEAEENRELATLDLATRGTYNLLTTTNAARIVLVTSLRPFARYPADWRVTEQWAPRPSTAVADLAPFLAELTARETARVRPIDVIVVRVGEVVESGSGDPWLLHVDDAVQGIAKALAHSPSAEERPTRWHVFHLVDGGARARFPLAAAKGLGYVPRHRLTDGAETVAPAVNCSPIAIPSRAVQRVVMFGSGGPLGVVTAEALAPDHHLRLTDARPLAEIAAGPPQSPGAPLPSPLGPPHETAIVDVTDPAAVDAACAGMDAIVNCTVVRPDPVAAFRVNTLGAYNVMRAAVAHSIRRVVQTGPIQTLLPHPEGYTGEFGLSENLPPRPGDNLYFVTKFLGQEICRIFAEEHQLETPTLLFCAFVNPAVAAEEKAELHPFTISWRDAGEAMRQAVRVPSFPRPFEVLHVHTDVPFGMYVNDKTQRLLDWRPRDRMEERWRRPVNEQPTA
jgi:nucleoside-diphosphate-sugar epimerase